MKTESRRCMRSRQGRGESAAGGTYALLRLCLYGRRDTVRRWPCGICAALLSFLLLASALTGCGRDRAEQAEKSAAGTAISEGRTTTDGAADEDATTAADMSENVAGTGEKTRVILTTGFAQDELFRVEELSCLLPEAAVYLTDTANRYKAVYGEELWKLKKDGADMETYVKDAAVAKLSRIKAMNLLAKQKGVALDASEEALALEAARTYIAALTEAERASLSITEDLAAHMYGEYALAEKVYAEIIKDINPEISDDEARVVTLEQVLLKTYELNGAGERTYFTGEKKEERYRLARDIRRQALSGETDFESLMAEYNEADEGTVYLGMGEGEEALVEAAMRLSTDEISDVLESGEGYVLLKCLSPFNQAETEDNKLRIIEERRRQTFGEEYDSFIGTLTTRFNEELWAGVALADYGDVESARFFTIYEEVFRKGER